MNCFHNRVTLPLDKIRIGISGVTDIIYLIIQMQTTTIKRNQTYNLFNIPTLTF